VRALCVSALGIVACAKTVMRLSYMSDPVARTSDGSLVGLRSSSVERDCGRSQPITFQPWQFGWVSDRVHYFMSDDSQAAAVKVDSNGVITEFTHVLIRRGRSDGSWQRQVVYSSWPRRA